MRGCWYLAGLVTRGSLLLGVRRAEHKHAQRVRHFSPCGGHVFPPAVDPTVGRCLGTRRGAVERGAVGFCLARTQPA